MSINDIRTNPKLSNLEQFELLSQISSAWKLYFTFLNWDWDWNV